MDQFVIDFYAPELKLAIELDGSIHELADQKEYDEARQEYLENFGIVFIRMTNDELLGNPKQALEKIAEKINQLRAGR